MSSFRLSLLIRKRTAHTSVCVHARVCSLQKSKFSIISDKIWEGGKEDFKHYKTSPVTIGNVYYIYISFEAFSNSNGPKKTTI